MEEAPSIPITCEDDPSQPNNKWVTTYVDTASNPEWGLVQRLLASKRGKALVGTTEDNLALEIKLMERQKKKALELMKTSLGKPEKVLPVSAFAISIGRQMQLIGLAGDQEFLLKVGEWLASSVKPLLNDLVQKHDYTKAGPLTKLSRMAVSLGSESPSVLGFLDDLDAALSFELQLTFDVDYGAERIVESVFSVAAHYDEVKRRQVIEGTGTGRYTKYWNPNVPAESVKATDFKVTTKIENVTACDGLATVSLDRFYPDQELTLYKDHSNPVPFMKPAWQQYNADRLKNGMYTLEFKVNNRREYAIDDSVDYGGSFKTNKFTVKLIHRPGKKKQ